MKHTPEPWDIEHMYDLQTQADQLLEKVGTEHEWTCICELDEEGNGSVVSLAHPDNAQRIVACVNACAGMENPEKEIKALKDALEIAKGFILRFDNPDEEELATAKLIDNVLKEARE